MPWIRDGFDGQTVITTFETTPGNAFDLIEALQAAYDEVISHQPGFLSAAVHVNDARTRVCTYSQWASRADFQAMLRHHEVRDRMRVLHEMCRSFEPVLHEVLTVY